MLTLILGCIIENSVLDIPAPAVLPIPEMNEKLDIIISLDCSGSMYDNLLTHYGLSQIPLDLDDYNDDWQLALITTDPKDLTYQYVLDSDTKDADWLLLTYMDEMTGKAGQGEAGIDAVHTYLQANNFYRGERLIIIFVSDEHDQSVSDPTVIGNLTNTEVVSIVGAMEPTEREIPCTDEYGTGYVGISDAIIDICSTKPWSLFETLKDTG